jgi:hypothetical protein
VKSLAPKRSWTEVATSGWLAAVVGTLVVVSCSRSITGSSSLLDPEWPRSANPTLRISAEGVNPDLLHLEGPVTVTVANDDGVAHRLDSAPELGYGTCAEVEQLGTLQPGQSAPVRIERREVICAYHDSVAAANPSFRGFIVVH